VKGSYDLYTLVGYEGCVMESHLLIEQQRRCF